MQGSKYNASKGWPHVFSYLIFFGATGESENEVWRHCPQWDALPLPRSEVNKKAYLEFIADRHLRLCAEFGIGSPRSRELNLKIADGLSGVYGPQPHEFIGCTGEYHRDS